MVLSQIDQVQLLARMAPAEKRLNIKFHKQSNILLVKGRSNVLDVRPAYLKLIEEVREHFKSSQKLTCYFKYLLMDSMTIKLLFDFFNVLQSAHWSKKRILVYWILDGKNDMVIDVGYHLWKKADFKFNIKSSRATK